MMICQGDIYPNLGLFDQVLRSEAVNPAPAGPGSRLLHYEKTGELATWPQLGQKALDLDIYPPDISASIW